MITQFQPKSAMIRKIAEERGLKVIELKKVRRRKGDLLGLPILAK